MRGTGTGSWRGGRHSTTRSRTWPSSLDRHAAQRAVAAAGPALPVALALTLAGSTAAAFGTNPVDVAIELLQGMAAVLAILLYLFGLS